MPPPNSTIDISPEETLLICMLLGQLIDSESRKLRGATSANDAEQARTRLQIATQLRGKMPLDVWQNGDSRPKPEGLEP